MPASVPRVAVLLCVLAAPALPPCRWICHSCLPGSRADLDGKLEFLDVERTDSSKPVSESAGQASTPPHHGFQFARSLRQRRDGNGRRYASQPFAEQASTTSATSSRIISPSLEFGEAYLQVETAMFDFRAGLQKFAWGKLDEPDAGRAGAQRSVEPAKVLRPAAGGRERPQGRRARACLDSVPSVLARRATCRPMSA